MHADSWALKAKKLGFRSRAVFKLEEILQKTKALKKNSLVLDIGSAPGGWSELVKALTPSSNIYSIDLLPICLLYTSPSPRDKRQSRMPSSA